jgi:hypothetical protein
MFRGTASRTQTNDYAALLNEALETFHEELTAGHLLLDAWTDAQSGADFAAWRAEYARWQTRTVEGNALNLRLQASRPTDRALVALHRGLVEVMRQRTIDLTQTLTMLVRIMNDDQPGATRARDAATRADRAGDAARAVCRTQLAELRREHAGLLASLGLPDWVIAL